MLTGETDEVRVAECIEAGAVDVVSKTVEFDDLVTAIREAVNGGSSLTDVKRRRLLDALDACRSAERERLAPFRSTTPATPSRCPAGGCAAPERPVPRLREPESPRSALAE